MKNETKPTDADVRSPWEVQRTLMAASDQHLPTGPELNKGTVLYARLNLEEGAELLHGLAKALERVSGDPSRDGEVTSALEKLAHEVDWIQQQMKDASLRMKQLLDAFPNDFKADLLEDEVIEMADGTTDLCVTNSGFALALGIDGAACYADVAQSNLSKRNPDTGVIDKTPDGKWIKGRDFKQPSLREVIYGQKSAPKAAAKPKP